MHAELPGRHTRAPRRSVILRHGRSRRSRGHIGLCCDILTEYAEGALPTPFYGVTMSFDDDRFRVRLAAVLVSLAAQRERRLARQAGPPSSSDAPRCSFCDRHRDAVAKLINGPAVYVCEACVAAAAQTIGDELHRRGTTI